MARTQQTPWYQMLHFNAIWPCWSERHADASVYEFLHTSTKKGIAGRARDEIMTQSPQGCARRWGVGDFKGSGSMFRRNRACRWGMRIILNFKSHYWSIVIYCTQQSSASSAKSKRLFLHNNIEMIERLNNVCITKTLKAPICTIKSKECDKKILYTQQRKHNTTCKWNYFFVTR